MKKVLGLLVLLSAMLNTDILDIVQSNSSTITLI